MWSGGNGIFVFLFINIYVKIIFAIYLKCPTENLRQLTGNLVGIMSSAATYSRYDQDFCSYAESPGKGHFYCVDCFKECPEKSIGGYSNFLLVLTKPLDNMNQENQLGKSLTIFTLDSRSTDIQASCNISQSTDIGKQNEGDSGGDALRSFSKTSVLFVSISFIILMVISLAWLVFYYVQRFRYAHAKDRLQRRLFNAARKALGRIALRTIQKNDEELQIDCAVCLDPYQVNDIVRILPCRHIYHKSCIDPWLLEHRTCPMCKSDILKHFGYHYTDNPNMRNPEEGVQQTGQTQGETGQVVTEIVSPEGTSESSGSAGFSFDHSEHIETFAFTPSVPPQLVLNASNAKSFVMPMSGRIGSAGNGASSREHIQPTSYSARGHNRNETPSRIIRTAVGTATTNGLPVITGHNTPNIPTGPQIVNLVQVKSRAASVTRAATIRKESIPQPTPIDVVIERPTTSTNTQTV
ncbi:unnamed protein product [Caenorhabditis angaria]|uniref:RING-type domain-containing protein n=1 Tax=Caenorhabditis angaria TaxID=860376 RepID=A0A9P1N2S4_9PELO|nr:unnamed protein product [Caenorhabditis angaria]